MSQTIFNPEKCILPSSPRLGAGLECTFRACTNLGIEGNIHDHIQRTSAGATYNKYKKGRHLHECSLDPDHESFLYDISIFLVHPKGNALTSTRCLLISISYVGCWNAFTFLVTKNIGTRPVLVLRDVEDM